MAQSERPAGTHEKAQQINKRKVVPMERVGKLCILEPGVRRVRESTRHCRSWKIESWFSDCLAASERYQLGFFFPTVCVQWGTG